MLLLPRLHLGNEAPPLSRQREQVLTRAPTETVSGIQPPQKTFLGSEWPANYRSPSFLQLGDGNLGRGCPPGGTTSFNMWLSFSIGFPGRKEIRERVESSPRVWVPNATQQLRICSQHREPGNDLRQTCLELISSAPTHPSTKALSLLIPLREGDCSLGDSPAVTHLQNQI